MIFLEQKMFKKERIVFLEIITCMQDENLMGLICIVYGMII